VVTVTAAELADHGNELWRRWRGELAPFDGFQVFELGELVIVARYGGAHWIGAPLEARRVMLDELRRIGRRRRGA